MAVKDEARLVAADIAIVVIYFAIVLAVGIWSSFRNRGSVGGYFLAGRSMHWIPVGASLFASNIGSGHFIGLAGSGAASGIGIAAFELNAIFILLLLGWIFVPVYIAAGVFTMPEYLRKRFGGQRIRVYLSVLALLLSIFTKVSADLYAGATFIEQSVDINLYLAVVILLAISAIFTITGGLTAVIWTDFAQTIIMIVGSFILMVISFIKVGGYQAVRNKFLAAVPNTTRYHLLHPELNYNYTDCGIPPANSFHLFRSADDPNLPWTGITIGLTISSIWYWCSDQVIVQRALAAKNLTYAKAGTIFAGYLKILPMWLLVLPGMIARILYPDEIGCADPEVCKNVCGISGGCSNVAYPTLVLELMPDGLRGLMLAVMIAALMSSLSSIFNSSATLFTMDIWTRIRKNANDTELMIVGRVFVLFMVAISILWLPIVKNFAELFHYIQSITSYLAPPICAIYVLAILWKRTNEQGAFWGLMAGLLVGLIRFIWEFSYSVPTCGEGEDPRPAVIKDVHYLHFGIILFCLVSIVTICVSLVTEPIADKHLPRLTFWSRYSLEKRLDISEVEKEASSGKDNPGLDLSKDVSLSHGSSAVVIEPEANAKSIPIWKKIGMWICGIEKQEELQMSEEDRQALEDKQTSLEEDPFWKKVVTINALVLMVIAVFFWAFFY